VLAAAALVAVAAAIGVATASARQPAARTAAAQRITFGNVTCAPGWGAPNPGRARFAVANRSGHVATIYLFRATSGAIVGQIGALEPGRTRMLTVRLRPGPYAWGCDLRGMPRHVSDAARVPVHGQLGGPGPKPIPLLTGEIAGQMRTYRGNVARQIGVLQAQVATLVQDLRNRDLAASESAWLTAHLTWLDIGQDDGAYGAFGDLGRQIDGTAAGLVDGTADPGFTGFHRVEFDLWRLGDLAAATRDAAVLASRVQVLARQKLATELPLTPLGLSTWTLRPHEILEDALRDSLSGNDDYGSGTGLASVTADVAITHELLTLLEPALAPRSPRLVATARRQLTAVVSAIDATRANGRWIAVAALTPAQRERVDAAVGAALETLAPIPDVLKVGGGS
jgi:high-affinity iron transporter